MRTGKFTLIGLLVCSLVGCAGRERLARDDSALPPETWTESRVNSDGRVAEPVEPVPTAPLPDVFSGPWMLADLEQIALGNNPTLLQAQARIDAAHGRWVQGGIRPNPVFGYSGAEIGDEGQAGQQGVFVQQQYVTHGKLGLNQEVAAREIERAELQAFAQRLRVLTDVRLGYYEVLIAQQRVSITENIQRISLDAVQTIRQLVAGEQATRVALLQAEVEAESSQVLVGNARNDLEAAWRRLAAVLGTPHEPLGRVEGQVDGSLPTVLWGEALDRMRSHSPEVAAAVANVERARWAFDRASVEARPNVNLQLGVGYDDATSDMISGLQVSVPFPIYNRNQGNLQSARADIMAAEQDVHRIELDLQRRFANVYRKYTNARERAEQYSGSILPRARETLDLVTMGYKAGEQDYPYVALLTAQRTLFNADLAYLAALKDVWSASVEVDGMLLTDSLAGRR